MEDIIEFHRFVRKIVNGKCMKISKSQKYFPNEKVHVNKRPPVALLPKYHFSK